MDKHSQALEKTRLWASYVGQDREDRGAAPGLKRVAWVKEIVDAAEEALKHVVITFPNYTLHDQTHILNVMDAMGGLLGNRLEELSTAEVELLILAAALHDLGMVYSEEEKRRWLENEKRTRDYAKARCPEKCGVSALDWEPQIQQDYLRWLHPFRVREVLERGAWQKLFEDKPLEAVPVKTLLAVCQAHGEEPEILRAKAEPGKGLAYSPALEADPLFCAVLLRLGDLLDFDDTRAPAVLFSAAEDNEKSWEEWKKHMASAGFTYPTAPSTEALPFRAECTNPGVERAIRTFLGWVDEELRNSRDLLRRCESWRRDFPLPFQVDTREIGRRGYDFGDFRLTMDQDQILRLLMGEDLYTDNTVFVRELLQNAIDATLLRGQLDPDFGKGINTDRARIDLWEWYDGDGQLWFRIDDRGIGMTRGMLQRYFLKVGNSYYNSKELERDLLNHRQQSFTGISRFGIGFLSCFLVGESAQVSTLYWDEAKSRREEERLEEPEGYGLRLDVTGLKGFFTLQNQAIPDNRPRPLPARPSSCCPRENRNYRSEPGTSIVLRLNPGNLGGVQLRQVAEKWLCFPSMPVYYNGQPLGMTQDQFWRKIKALPSSWTYTLTEKQKREFDAFAPELAGKYPELHWRLEYLDLSQQQCLPQIKGVFIQIKTQSTLPSVFTRDGNLVKIRISRRLMKESSHWKLSLSGGIKEPNNTPLQKTLMIPIDFPIPLLETYLRLKSKAGKDPRRQGLVAYQGIAAGYLGWIWLDTLVFTELNQGHRPDVAVSRDRAMKLPLEPELVLSAWLASSLDYPTSFVQEAPRIILLPVWRKLAQQELFQKWMLQRTEDELSRLKKELEEPGPSYFCLFRAWKLDLFFAAQLQEQYSMTIDYEAGQSIAFQDRDPAEEGRYDGFPPMLFCKAATEQSRGILCHRVPNFRRGITADHAYAVWLLDHSEALTKHFPAQLWQIQEALIQERAGTIIDITTRIRDQLLPIAHHFGISMETCPVLTEQDFWQDEE